MAQYQGPAVTGKQVIPMDAVANVVLTERFSFVTTAPLAAGDIIEIGQLGPYCHVGDAILMTDDLDTNGTPLVTLDVGIMSGLPGVIDAGRTCGNELFAADVVGRAGGISRMTKIEGFRIATTEEYRSIGVKVVAAPATPVASGSRITLQLSYYQ